MYVQHVCRKSWSWSWYLLGCASCSPSSALVEPGLSGNIYIRSELRSLVPPMTRYPTWLPDAQGARRVVAGSMLSQGDVSFGDAPLLLNRRRRGTPVGETASRRWEYTTKLEARTVYSVFTRCALETCRAPRSRLLKAIRRALSRKRGPPIDLARLGAFCAGGDGDGTTLHLSGDKLFC